MTRWPDFFIVGAPRSGTTSLFYYLREHPDIFMPSVKEPHFFNEINYSTPEVTRRALPAKLVRVETAYLKLFEGAQSKQVMGEASVSYLSDKVAPVRIKGKNPRAKIIAVLREPVGRAYSSYLLALREGREWKPSFYEAVKEDWEYMHQFSDFGSVYIWRGLYYKHVRRYLDTFGKEQVRIYLYEDLISDTIALVEDLCTFLGVPFYNGSFFDPSHKYHTYGAPRNALFKWVGRSRTVRSIAASLAPMHLLIPLRDRLVDREQPKPQLDPKALEFLRSIYHDDILKLQGLIGRDLSNWLA
jgi:hypothetical protein